MVKLSISYAGYWQCLINPFMMTSSALLRCSLDYICPREACSHFGAKSRVIHQAYIRLVARGGNICQRFPIVIEIIPLIEALSRETT